jgi:hypothetical protein
MWNVDKLCIFYVVCLGFLLQVWSVHHGVSGTKEARIDPKNDYFNNDAWDLVEAENKAITSLSELSDGVFSLQLAVARSACETGTEFGLSIFRQTYAFHSICIILFNVLLQSIWVSTTGPAPLPCPPNQPLGQSCAVSVRVHCGESG